MKKIIPSILSVQVPVSSHDSSDGVPFIWDFKLDLQNGYVVDWIRGSNPSHPAIPACVRLKVTDHGRYELFDEAGDLIAVHTGYVPGCLDCGGYGDSIILAICLRTGRILNLPDILEFPEFGDNIASINPDGSPLLLEESGVVL